MNVLALDLGTHTGWALRENGRIESGVQVFDVKRGESPGMRYIRFRRWIHDVTVDVHASRKDLPGTPLRRWVGMIVYEQTHNRGGAATEVAAGFATRVQEFCAEHTIEHAAIHSATLKKFTTGSGRGDKAAMMAAAILKPGWLQHKGAQALMTLDDNEVDAVCLLHYALEELVPTRG